MKSIPKISEAEWEVMKVLWNQSPLSSLQVVQVLTPATGWKPNTIKTLLARLVKKGAVTADKSSRDHLYSAHVAEEQCVRAENRSFLARVYNGATMPMIAGILQQEKLTPEEIARLRQILDNMEKASRK